MLKSTDDLRISAIKELTTPIEVMRQHPRTDAATRTVLSARHAFHNILAGTDDRLAVVVHQRDTTGPAEPGQVGDVARIGDQQALRADVPASTMYVAGRIESDDRVREAIRIAGSELTRASRTNPMTLIRHPAMMSGL